MGETGEQRRAALRRDLDGRLAATDVALAARYPGPPTGRQPVHTVYVPADRFDGGTAAPVEDLRVDFEDGYGRRGDDEEDAAATGGRHGARVAATRAAVRGLRHKSLEADTRDRAVRTLDLFLEAYLSAGGDRPR